MSEGLTKIFDQSYEGIAISLKGFSLFDYVGLVGSSSYTAAFNVWPGPMGADVGGLVAILRRGLIP
jgi:hypothetical protein